MGAVHWQRRRNIRSSREVIGAHGTMSTRRRPGESCLVIGYVQIVIHIILRRTTIAAIATHRVPLHDFQTKRKRKRWMTTRRPHGGGSDTFRTVSEAIEKRAHGVLRRK